MELGVITANPWAGVIPHYERLMESSVFLCPSSIANSSVACTNDVMKPTQRGQRTPPPLGEMGPERSRVPRQGAWSVCRFEGSQEIKAKSSRRKEALWGRSKGIFRNPLYLLLSSHVKYLHEAVPVACLRSVVVYVRGKFFWFSGSGHSEQPVTGSVGTCVVCVTLSRWPRSVPPHIPHRHALFPSRLVLFSPDGGRCFGKPPPPSRASMRRGALTQHSETRSGVVYVRSVSAVRFFWDKCRSIPLFCEAEGTFYCISPANGGLIPTGIVTGAFPGLCNGG